MEKLRENYVRGCSLCGNEIFHLDYYSFVKGVVEKKPCQVCAKKHRPIKTCKCEKCSKEFTYKTSKPKLCKECQEEKVKLEIGTRNCPQCSSLITFKNKYDRILADKKNSLCKKCVGRNASPFRKGKNKKDIWLEKGYSEIESQRMYEESEKKRLEARKGYCHSQETLDKIFKGRELWCKKGHTKETKLLLARKNKERFSNPEERKKSQQARLKVIKERPELELQRYKNLTSNRLQKELKGEYCGGSSKYFIIHGISCQGNWERMYIESLSENKRKLIKKPSSIKTLSGYYTPDFEIIDNYIEIKSDYTYDVCRGKKKNWRGVISDKQMQKIIWVGQNIKPVQLLVLDKKGEVIKEEWFK